MMRIQLLVILSVMFFLSLAAPSVWAAGAVNAFSLDLVRLWTPDTLDLHTQFVDLAAMTELYSACRSGWNEHLAAN